ncbi:hypothetical protein AAGS61_03395 [Lysinibacillus sp. KU-BSD001]|uniref:hypothetical protein n=1 Tax=Lysinibacillus sp. KU-BSD001 TaxID=3141328 RepID=UPI0036EC0B4B
MRKLYTILSTSMLTLCLVGCSDTLVQIKDAASGINSAADQAATAISQDVHSIRAIEVTYNDQTFTINDLFKSILRDVQWHYEPSQQENVLLITGTWQPSLFDAYGIDQKIDNELAVHGEVTIELMVEENMIHEEKTKVTLVKQTETLLEENGQDILHYLYDYYTMNKITSN